MALLSHFECDSHIVHMLTRQVSTAPLTNTMKSSLFMHAHTVHCPWLPGYTDVAQTVVIILTTTELFLDRPRCIPSTLNCVWLLVVAE